MPAISIVIPVHDEADSICGLIREIGKLGLTGGYEIVVVDDASNDGTYTNLVKLQPDVPELIIVRHEGNYGQSAAIATGVARAGGELIVTLDGDGQNDPVDIPKLLDVIMKAGDPDLRMVAGFRKKRNDSAWRVVSSKIANVVRSFFLGDETPDTGCGLKVFYRSSFMALPFFDHMHRFLPALVRMQGGKVVSVEVSHRARLHGASKYGTLNRLWAGIFDLWGVYWLRLRSKEIRIKENSNDLAE